MPAPTNRNQTPVYIPKGVNLPAWMLRPEYQSQLDNFITNGNNNGQRIGTVPNGEDPSRGSFLINGQVVPYAQFQQQNPQALSQWATASGLGASIPAGQPGSPYPAALPVNSFEAAINDARAAMEKANAENEKRYNQGLANTSNQGKLVDSSFAGIGSRIDEDNRLAQQDQANIISGAKGAGDFAISEAKRAGAANEGRATASALSRGLFGSTVLDSLRRRESEATNRNVADLTDKQIQYQTTLKQGAAQSAQAGRLRRADVQQNYTTAKYNQLGDRRGFIERRVDEGPNPADIASLIANREVGQASARAQSSNGAGLAAGLGLLGQLGGAAIGAFSDKRLKKDLKQVGTKVIDGEKVPIYTYKYTEAAKRSGRGQPGKFRGPLAQDVKRADPKEVGEDAEGFEYLKGKYAGRRKKVSK